MSRTLAVRGVPGIGEIGPDTDLAALVAGAVPDLADGDVVVVTSKAVSKAEDRLVAGLDREAAITAETVRVVARRGPLRIVETRHGLVTAAAGVDASNVPLGSIALLPVDPDASARRLRDGLLERTGRNVAVLVTDTGGRTWRDGVVDVAIGLAGLDPADDLRGRTDDYGNPLSATVVAVADEVAGASELVRPKLGGVPVAVVTGLGELVLPAGSHGAGASALVRGRSGDLFPLGSRDVLFGFAIPIDHSVTLLTSYIRKNDRDLANQDANQMAVGASYAVSRRTDFYAAYSHIRNRNGAGYTVGNASAPGSGNKAFNIGMRHAF